MTDPFDLLGLPAQFDLDSARLDQAYLAAAATVHPDLTTGEDASGQTMAALNDARRLLENPESRADLLLRRLGGPASNQERSLPAAFLAEMMEVRQAIESDLADSSGRDKARVHWESWARDRRSEAISDISGMFAALPSHSTPREAALRQIRIRLNQWRYVERLIEQLDPAYDARAGM